MELNTIPEYYKEFSGRNTEQMPKLIADNRSPLSVAGLMEARLKHGKELTDWMNNSFQTGDALIYHPDGRIKIALDSEQLRQISSESELIHGSLALKDGVYDSISGKEFKRSELKKYTKKDLSLKQVKSNPIWQNLARDQNLLDEYADFIFNQEKLRFDSDKNMGIHLDYVSDVPKLSALHIAFLEDGSSACCWSNFDYDSGSFVGVLNETAESS